MRAAANRRLWSMAAAAVIVAVVGTVVGAVHSDAPPTIRSAPDTPPTTTPGLSVVPGSPSFLRLRDPGRTVLVDPAGAATAVLTDGSRTVVLGGRARTLTEPAARVPATTSAWVRLLPEPWAPGAETRPWFADWLRGAAADTSPDVLAVAVAQANETATRRVGGGVRFTDGSPATAPAPAVSNTLFLARTWQGLALPTGAAALAELPSTEVVPDRGRPATEYGRLQPGDLVFFDTDPVVDRAIDHVGVYLGVDHEGHHRFVSSRSVAGGPTFGDLGGSSVLDGEGHYSAAFRAARRL